MEICPPGGLGGALQQAGKALGRERHLALRGEHERRRWLLVPLEFAQSPQFAAAERVRAGRACLTPADVEVGAGEMDLIPAQVDIARSRAARA